MGPPMDRSSLVWVLRSWPDARGASIRITFLCAVEAARSAAWTPTGPAPMTARSYSYGWSAGVDVGSASADDGSSLLSASPSARADCKSIGDPVTCLEEVNDNDGVVVDAVAVVAAEVVRRKNALLLFLLGRS